MQRHALSPTEQWLFAQYGGLIDSSDAARILGFKSPNALAQARSRGRLQIEMIKVPHRRGLWTTPHSLASYLSSLTAGQAQPLSQGEEAMDG